jgi:ubiquinone/menaquinone biosynthesis C-methylase UbiE
MDDFYEGKFTRTARFTRLHNNSLFRVYSKVSYSQLRFDFFDGLMRSIPCGNVLDLGCGGGNQLFSYYAGTVVGVDLSLAAVKSAAQIYESVYHADATKLPFNDGTFEVIVSADLFGHIPFNLKDHLFAEVYRVLKPGGYCAAVIEVDGKNLLTTFAKEYPILWQKYFIEKDGHFGLELPSKVIHRFQQHQLAVRKLKKHYCDIYPTFGFLRRFDNEYTDHSDFVRVLVAMCGIIERWRLLSLGVNFLVGVFARPFDILVDLGRATCLFVVAQKEQT